MNFLKGKVKRPVSLKWFLPWYFMISIKSANKIPETSSRNIDLFLCKLCLIYLRLCHFYVKITGLVLICVLSSSLVPYYFSYFHILLFFSQGLLASCTIPLHTYKYKKFIVGHEQKCYHVSFTHLQILLIISPNANFSII